MRKLKPSRIAIVALAVCFLVFSGAAQTNQKSADWKAADCSAFEMKGDLKGAECGYVTVPLKHAEPNGRKIELAVVIFPAKQNRQPDPLFYAQGGPGGTTIGTFAPAFILDDKYLPVLNREIVLWDQRGTKFSKPFLGCPEIDDLELRAMDADAVSPTPQDMQKASDACRDRMVKDAGDISAFNSVENANDIEFLRKALGYEKINYYGVSYGTELGQYLMRQHGANVRSVMLDGVVPTTYNLFTEPAFAMQRIATKYFDGCKTDAECNEAFPDLGKRYLALVERLNANPVTLSVTPLDLTKPNAKAMNIKLTGEVLQSTLYSALYGNIEELVPIIIDKADKGDYTYLTSWLLPTSFMGPGSIATGMHLSVACADYGNTDAAKANYTGLFPKFAESQRKSASEEVKICKDWGIQLLPREMVEPISSSLPTLLISGEFDPITPPPYAEQLKKTLSNSQHVIFPRGSHGQMVANSCANSIAQAFLDNPSAPVNSSCVNTGKFDFVTDKDIIFIPAFKHAIGNKGIFGLYVLGGEDLSGIILARFMLSALPIYGLARLIRGKAAVNLSHATDWTAKLSMAAPFLALGSGLSLFIFILMIALTIFSLIAASQESVFLGGIPRSNLYLWAFAYAGIVGVAGMVAAMVAMWIGHHRSILSRLYFTVLTLTGIGIVIGLRLLGLV